VDLESGGVGELRAGDGVAAHHLEAEAEGEGPGRGQPADDHGEQQGHHDSGDAGGPLHHAAQEPGPFGRDQERRKHPGQEEHAGIHHGEDAEPLGGLAQQIRRQAGREVAALRRGLGREESDLLVHGGPGQ